MNIGENNKISEAMKWQVRRLDTVTDNLANSTTPGYRSSRVSTPSFDEALNKTEETSKNTNVNFTPGSLRMTSNPLDFAINGSGFFVTEKDGEEYYTRNGNFKVNQDGELVTQSGLLVIGENGKIKLPKDLDTANLTVDSDCSLRVGKERLAKIKLVDFENPDVLTKVGSTAFKAPEEITPIDQSENSSITNRSLEGSNTSIFGEMAEMISCMRSYESCQKMLKSQDQAERNMIKYMS